MVQVVRVVSLDDRLSGNMWFTCDIDSDLLEASTTTLADNMTKSVLLNIACKIVFELEHWLLPDSGVVLDIAVLSLSAHLALIGAL